MSKYRDSLDDKGKASLDKLEKVRASGHRGWVDQDSNKVACPCCGKPSCTAGLTERCNG